MSEVGTVYIRDEHSKDDPTKSITQHKGYISKLNELGVWINDREDARGTTTFYPMHLVAKVVYNTGW